MNNFKVTIASIYAPDKGRLAFLEEIFQQIITFGEGKLIIAGDFNYIADFKMDRTYLWNHRNALSDHSYMRPHSLLEKFNFTDCCRHLNPTTKDNTYFSSRHNVNTHIDFLLTLKLDNNMLQSAEIGLKSLTDHL